MTVDFAALPPEVNSGRIYSGPGSGPMLAAAEAWHSLAAELASAATAYRALISELIDGSWRGPAAMSMSAAVSPYVEWMTTTAGLAQQAAVKARSAAVAYEEAFAMTVPPPVIAANRSLLASLVATNIVGQNTPAIAATQAHYAEMWAQDAAAMYTYAGRAATATTLTPFTGPRPNTNPAGGQTVAVSRAVANSVTSQIPHALQALATGPVQANGPISQFLIELFTSPIVVQLETLFTNISPATTLISGIDTWSSAGMFALVPLASAWITQAQSALGAAGAAASATTISDVSGKGLGSTLVNFTDAAAEWKAASVSGVSTGLGHAGTVGGLSVPQTWDTSKVRLASVSTALPRAGAGTDGLYAGAPPIGSVVNAPHGAQPPVQGPRSNLTPQLTGSTGAQDISTRSANPGSTAADAERRITERDELEALRRAVSEVSIQTDTLREQASILLHKAMKR